jgi:hypothetical protein
MVQEPAAPQVFDNALPTPGLQAHTAVSRFVDHIPYYRQEHINARSGVHTPRSTLAAWGGQTGAQLMPLYEVHRAFVLACRVLNADETPIALLDPGAGKTKKAYMWAYYLEPFFIQSEPVRFWRSCGEGTIRTPNKTDRSQGLQERKQVGRGLPRLRVRRFDAGLLPECLHGLALHLQVDRDVAVSCGDAGVAQVVADYRHVGAGLQ